MFSYGKSNYCALCLREKYFIINYPHKGTLLNKQSKLISKCRYENKNLLAPILEAVAREIMIAWINIMNYILLFCILFS